MNVDEALSASAAYFRAAESVVQAFRVLSPQHRSTMLVTFPTLNTALQQMSAAHKPLDPPSP